MKRLELEKADPAKSTTTGSHKLKSTAPSDNAEGYGAREGSLHRVFLMRNSQSSSSVGFGFAEFWTLEDATAALTKFRMHRSFTIGGKAVNVSSIHMGVFVPETREMTSRIDHESFEPLINPEIRVRYRDLRAYPSQHVVTAAPPKALEMSRSDEADGRKSKKRKAEGATGASKKAVPMAGTMAMWQQRRQELHGGENSIENTDAKSTTEAHRDAAQSHSWKLNPNAPIKISLSGTTSLGLTAGTSSTSTAVSSNGLESSGSVAESVAVTSEAPKVEDKPELYMDRERFMCLICMRKYKSIDEVNIHERSRNHKSAMEDNKLVEAALPRLAARDKRLSREAQARGEAESSGSQYRDRAKERREAFNQPTKPSAQPGKAATDSNRTATSSKQANGQNKPLGDVAPSKGAGMLAKMGWTAGAGLGANNDGRTDFVATNAYQEGVGLGADGGKLGDAAEVAQRNTTNQYADYVNTVQDKARERFNKME